MADKSTDTKAVALKYDWEDAHGVPRIVASGEGWVAERILELAFANGVRVREDADLVEVLTALEVDSLIPEDAYMAVAEILSYVYRANAGAPQRQRSSITSENSSDE